MANSKSVSRLSVLLIYQTCIDFSTRYEYVKDFEQPDILLPNTWIVVRIDGRGFHKYEPVPLMFKQYLTLPDYLTTTLS